MDVPAGTPMPTPVPCGQFNAAAAAMSEGFCPACKVPFTSAAVTILGTSHHECGRCGARWIWLPNPPAIRWESAVDDINWVIETLPDQRVYGTAIYET